MAIAGIACGDRKATEGDEAGSLACGEPVETDSSRCGDGQREPGEYCPGDAQSFALGEEGSAFPPELRPELLIADFDGDDRPELMTGRFMLRSDGQGGYVEHVPPGSPDLEHAQLAELDGAAGADLVTSYSVYSDYVDLSDPDVSWARVFLFRGGGEYPELVDPDLTTGTLFGSSEEDTLHEWQITDLAVGDLDGDALDDIAVAVWLIDFDLQWGQLYVLFNRGNFEFERVLVDTSGSATILPVAIGPLGGDWGNAILFGANDVFIPGVDGFVAHSAPPGITGLARMGHDIDCDALPDVISSAPYEGVHVHRGQASEPYLGIAAQFIAADPGAPEPGEHAFAEPALMPWQLADLDGDGLHDLLLTDYRGASVAFAGSGGEFRPPILLDTPHPWIAVQAADLDGDGSLDLAGVWPAIAEVHGGIDVVLSGT
jgi:hypothetical protein